MINYLLWIMIVSAATIQAQNLTEVVQKIKPELYIHNMDNKPVYHQKKINKNSLGFTRLYRQRMGECKEKSYHYMFLNEQRRNWILEIRLDQHDFRIPNGKEMQVVRSSDFGIVVYQLQDEQWVEVTHDVLPENFAERFEQHFPQLQRGSWGYYYYNQNPECIIHPNWRFHVLHFKQKRKKALSLAWRKWRFVWN